MTRMVQSFSTLSYEGVFVRSQGLQMNSMKIRHGLIDGSEYESLVDLDGQKVEVIRIDNSVICVYPDISFANTALPVSAPLKQFKELNGERLQEGYQFRVAESVLLAGRRAQKLALLPKDNYRFGHDFWLDEETGFLLKHDTLNQQGQVIDRVQFTSLNLAPEFKKADFTPKMGSYSQHLVEVTPKMTANKWRFDWLPVGFAPVWRDARVMDNAAEMLLLSDGMTSISVFIKPATETKAISVMTMGATTAAEKTMMINDKQFLITIVGEVPTNTVQRLLTVFMPRSIK